MRPKVQPIAKTVMLTMRSQRLDQRMHRTPQVQYYGLEKFCIRHTSLQETAAKGRKALES